MLVQHQKSTRINLSGGENKLTVRCGIALLPPFQAYCCFVSLLKQETGITTSCVLRARFTLPLF